MGVPGMRVPMQSPRQSLLREVERAPGCLS